jgi:3-oxoacyl-[acyl-carrier protein] reductase
LNRIILITGAATGLGLSLATRFIQAGDTVYGTSLTKRNWKTAQTALPSSNFSLAQVDGANEAKVRTWISKVAKKTGRIDVLICNSGYANQPTKTELETLKEVEANFRQNFVTAFLTSKHSIPFFKKQKNGWLINISSMAGVRAVPLLTAYSASKFGVLALTQAVAKENEGSDFKAITVSPGGMNTQMRSKLFGKKDASKQQPNFFVALNFIKIIDGEIPMKNGENIIIRHSRVTAIQPLPGA